MDRRENDPEYLTPGWRGSEKTAFVSLRETVADSLARAAHALHEKSSQAEEESELANFGIRAADWLERSADYVKMVEPRQLKSDFEDQVRRHPGRSLLIAGIAGLILGRVFRRR